MSYDSSDTIAISIEVRYHSVKATQYFSKWSNESLAIFRADLTTLKSPHPKRDNIELVSHACVRGFWPAVQRNGLLRKQLTTLKNNLKPSCPALSKLSISVFSVKFGLDPAASANPLKRPLQSTYTDYADKRPRLQDQADTGRPKSRFDQDNSYPPIPAVNRIQAPWHSLDRAAQDGTHIDNTAISTRTKSFPQASSTVQKVLPSTRPPTMRSDASHSGSVIVNNPGRSPSTATRTSSIHAPSKPIPRESSSYFRDSPNTSLNAQSSLSTSGSTSSAVSAARVNPPPSSGKAVTNNVTNGALPNSMSQNTIARAAHATTSSAAGPNSSAQSSSISTLTQRQYLTREQIVNFFKEHGETLPEDHEYLTSQTVTLAEITPAIALLVRARKDRDEVVQKIKDKAQGIYSGMIARCRKEHVQAQILTTNQGEAQALAPVTPSLGGDESRLKEQIVEGLAALKEAQEQISNLTTQLRGEQTLRANAETLLASTQQELQDTSKRLSQSETNLEVERIKRKDAEDAIQDIRRECRSPFIVPSLLDAFVELSRMTTMATIAPPPESATQHPPKDTEVRSPEARVKQEFDYWIV